MWEKRLRTDYSFLWCLLDRWYPARWQFLESETDNSELLICLRAFDKRYQLTLELIKDVEIDGYTHKWLGKHITIVVGEYKRFTEKQLDNMANDLHNNKDWQDKIDSWIDDLKAQKWSQCSNSNDD